MTWATLRALWLVRDSRYRERKMHNRHQPLSEAEEQSIRWYRRTEVALLSSPERKLAMMVLRNWSAPVVLGR